MKVTRKQLRRLIQEVAIDLEAWLQLSATIGPGVIPYDKFASYSGIFLAVVAHLRDIVFYSPSFRGGEDFCRSASHGRPILPANQGRLIHVIAAIFERDAPLRLTDL